MATPVAVMVTANHLVVAVSLEPARTVDAVMDAVVAVMLGNPTAGEEDHNDPHDEDGEGSLQHGATPFDGRGQHRKRSQLKITMALAAEQRRDRVNCESPSDPR